MKKVNKAQKQRKSPSRLRLVFGFTVLMVLSCSLGATLGYLLHISPLGKYDIEISIPM